MARTWERSKLVIWVWCVLCGSCAGRFVVEKNSLKVATPESLQGSYESAIGNFGVPQYGWSVKGNVTYPKDNQDACKSFIGFNASFKSAAGGLPTFLLADRGECYFTLKAWNAQNGGAAAILVTDDRDGDLITMDTPGQDHNDTDYLQKITIPAALIKKSVGDDIKKALSDGLTVTVNLDWTEALPHPDERVEYEFWTNSNDECGPKCDAQIKFVKNFKGAAQILERKGYAQFTPHYITWFCPPEFLSSEQCGSQCINSGRYCTPDPDQDFSKGYKGRDVVLQNLRQICFFKVANASSKPWLWWDFVSDFAIRCPMKEEKFTKECAEKVIQSLGVDLEKINQCIGDPDADMDNPVLKAEQDAQIGEGSRGDVSILPTLIINNRQYRGKLDRGAVLKAICSGFQETTEPAICLSSDIETNECLENNGGCWQDKVANITACRDTFRGRVCECPLVQGVKFVGDGYTRCEASGALRCETNNGGCWNETRGDRTVSACVDDSSTGCKCPLGFTGDGVNSCEANQLWASVGDKSNDCSHVNGIYVDECKEKKVCQCPECKCKDTWGGFECTCSSGFLYMQEYDTCISTHSVKKSNFGGFFWIVIFGLAAAGVGVYAVYKYRIRSYMDAEIRSIMAQYMPLDGHVEVPSHGSHVDI